MKSNKRIRFLRATMSLTLMAGLISCATTNNQNKPNYQQQKITVSSYPSGAQGDDIGSLIRDSEKAYQTNTLIIQEKTRVDDGSNPSPNVSYGTSDNNWQYNNWLNTSDYRQSQVNQYYQYLEDYLGAGNVPPMDQLLTTARSWDKCGYEPFQLPPRELWSNIVATLVLYNDLKSEGVIPQNSEIRSVYRSPSLNACAGGSDGSKHMSNGAIDIWVPEFEGQPWYINPMQDKLCQFWFSKGMNYNFGLGVYSSGAIHLDTQGYRLWGERYTAPGSYCRYLE